MAEAIPFLSNLEATGPQVRCRVVYPSRHKKPSAYKPYLGLPSRRTFGPQYRKKVEPTGTSFLQSETGGFAMPEQPQQTGQSILSQMETPRILEKQYEEVNSSYFLNQAAANTVESLARVAQKKARQLNSLKNNPNSKKRKPDIFDKK